MLFEITCLVLALDAAVIFMCAGPAYGRMVQKVQQQPLRVDYFAAACAYVLIVLQLYWLLAVVRRPEWAFFLGASTYGIFALTNYALFAQWAPAAVLFDVAWGGILYMLVALLVTVE